MLLQTAAADYAQSPTPQAERCVAALLERQLYILCRTMLRAAPTPDQLQEARIAALQALRSYNPRRSKFVTHLPIYVRKALYRNQSDLIRIPEHQRLLLARLDALNSRCLYEHARTPTDAEIGSALDLTAAQVRLLHQTVQTVFGIGEYSEEQGEDPYQPVDTKLDVRNAFRALEKLNPVTAQVARLHYIEGKPIKTITGLLRVGSATVDKCLADARQFLRERLSEYG